MASGEAAWTSFSETHTERHVRFTLHCTDEQIAALDADDAPPLHRALKLEARNVTAM